MLPTAVVAAVALPFLLFGELPVEELSARPTWSVATLAITFLALDTLLPVPSSVVLVLLGARLGIFWGAVAGAIGLTCGAVLGLWIGRAIASSVGAEQRSAAAAVERLGWTPALSVALLRGVPVLAETSAILAGTRRADVLAVIRLVLPASLVLAIAGSWAGSAGAQENPAWLAAGAVLVPVAAALPAAATLIRVRTGRSSKV